jgi:hypothetical protein
MDVEFIDRDSVFEYSSADGAAVKQAAVHPGGRPASHPNPAGRAWHHEIGMCNPTAPGRRTKARPSEIPAELLAGLVVWR